MITLRNSAVMYKFAQLMEKEIISNYRHVSYSNMT